MTQTSLHRKVLFKATQIRTRCWVNSKIWLKLFMDGNKKYTVYLALGDDGRKKGTRLSPEQRKLRTAYETTINGDTRQAFIGESIK